MTAKRNRKGAQHHGTHGTRHHSSPRQLNDLIDQAEDPEKMLKQLVLDMENQLLQVKTQVAIAIADQHLLEKKAG